MLTCREISERIARGADDEAGFFGKLSIKMHLMMCVHCRRFLRQVRLIGSVARQRAEDRYREHPPPDGMEKRLVARLCGTAADQDNGKDGA